MITFSLELYSIHHVHTLRTHNASALTISLYMMTGELSVNAWQNKVTCIYITSKTIELLKKK